MTKVAMLHRTAGDAVDHLVENIPHQELKSFREEFGMRHWELRVRDLPGRDWQVFFTETEEDHDLGSRIGELVEEASSSVPRWTNIFRREEPCTEVCLGMSPFKSLIIVRLTDDPQHVGLTRTAYLVGRLTFMEACSISRLFDL